MPLDTPALLDALNSVTAIPIIPFRHGRIDYEGHAKNVQYLMRANRLDGGRPRVISVAGTSLIHHVEPEEQTRVFDVTGQAMGSAGVLMSAIAPNPIGTAGRLIEAQAKLRRPPDVYLIMPLTGTYDADGIYDTFLNFARRYGEEYGARFLYYFRSERDRAAVIRLLNDSPHFIGVKIGTSEADVEPFVQGVGDRAMVIWGIGDRSTLAAENGAKGHTSGTAVVATGVCDAINNAQRQGDFATARRLEGEVKALEEIRFMNGRVYNYSAVAEALMILGFADVEAGDCSGPFNPRVPPAIRERVREAVQHLAQYH
ncbi:MAG TPA: dihydrodipicolinate synthase family protein [Caldilineaceae bacterium]|nr:dihydrodipicolinate synthase family protein [Caldilineaceae bacterium]